MYLTKKQNPRMPPPKRGGVHHLVDGGRALCQANHKAPRPDIWVLVDTIGCNGRLCENCDELKRRQKCANYSRFYSCR